MKRKLTSKPRQLIFLIVMSTLLFLQACSGIGAGTNSLEEGSPVDNKLESVEISEEDEKWDAESSTAITMNDNDISIDGSGAAANNSTVTITESGTYVLTGSLSDGQVQVDAADEAEIQLVLNGVSITNKDNPAIYIINAKQTTVTLAEGTENYLEDGSTYTFQSEEDDEPDAVLFSDDDLVLNGAGNLMITANYKNAIKGKDDLLITNGVYSIDSVQDGIKGRDSIVILGGTFTINAEKDAIQSTNDTDEGKGYILIEDGLFNLTTLGDGIQAETDLEINGGTYNIVTNGGSKNADPQEAVSDFGGWSMDDNSTESEEEDSDDSISSKGIKAKGTIVFNSGQFDIDSLDDAIHSDDTIIINDGDFILSTGDDGIHADRVLTIEDGTIVVQESYEGLEGLMVTINGGRIELNATDDGINASGESSLSAEIFGPQNQLTGNSEDETEEAEGNSDSEEETPYIQINGGEIFVNADGDGIDSNGDINMTGGLLVINGPTDNGNGAIDYDGAFNLSGGTLLATGSAQMAMAQSATSSQASIVSTDLSMFSGDIIQITDSDNEVLLLFELKKDSQSLVFSSENVINGESYVVTGVEEVLEESDNGLYENPSSYEGTVLAEITAATEQVFSGMMGPGGNQMPGGQGAQGGSMMPRGGQRPDMNGEEEFNPEEGDMPDFPEGMEPPSGSGPPESGNLNGSNTPSDGETDNQNSGE